MFNRIFYTATAIIFLILLVLFARTMWKAFNLPEDPSSDTYVFPIDTKMPTAREGRLFVPTKSGTTLEVDDIREQSGIHTVGSGNYVTGSLNETTAPLYQLVYFEIDRSYLISLESEPLGLARQEGENDLIARLGISRQAACDLLIRVGTSRDVNPDKAAMELGVSFCPGAVSLE